MGIFKGSKETVCSRKSTTSGWEHHTQGVHQCVSRHTQRLSTRPTSTTEQQLLHMCSMGESPVGPEPLRLQA